MKQFYSIPEVAKLLGTNRINIYRKVKRGDISAQKVGGSFVISGKMVNSMLKKDEVSSEEKDQLTTAVKRVVSEYGEVLKKLGQE
jgi:excisionase family DNA binding protein